MKISWIYARNTDWLIGNENKLPWKSKTDMEHFRNVTYGNAVVMGRKTFESLGCKPLQGRLNVVVTRDVNYKAPNNVLVLHDIEDINRLDCEEIFIIGGAEIYSATYHMIDMVYESIIFADAVGDTYMPLWLNKDTHDYWKLKSSRFHNNEDVSVIINQFERTRKS